MSTRWETLVGDTSRFAVKMGFLDDDSEIPVAPDMAASWGSFEVWVNGANLCAHVEEAETLEAVYWYLLPLLEWLTANWNPMLHEERLPIRNAGEDAASSLYQTRFPRAGLDRERALEHEEVWFRWRQRHGLHAAREGGLFPELFLRRWEDRIEASWSNQAPPGSPAGFSFLVPHGRALLDPEEVAGPIHAVARAAVEQLHTWVPTSDRISALQASLRALNKPGKQRADRLNWLFNLEIEGVSEAESWPAVRKLFDRAPSRVRRAILEPLGNGLVLRGSSHAVLLFGSVSPTVALSDARALAGILVDLFNENGDSPELVSLVDEVESTPFEGRPWEQGYELADRVHEAMSLSGNGRVDIEGVLRRLGVEVGALSLSDHRVRGVAVAGPDHVPAVIPNESHPRNQSAEGRRFTLAHEFCHLLADRASGRRLAIATGPWAPIEIEQRANAFAAHFLMPPEQVRAVIAGLANPVASLSSVRTVADVFGTSPRATLEHLHNLGWLDDFERDMLRGTSLDEEAFGRPAVEIGG